MTIDITAQNSAFLFIDVQEKLVGMLQKDKCAKKLKYWQEQPKYWA